MKHTNFFLVLSLIGLFYCQTPEKPRVKYPISKKVDTIDSYFDKEIKDPFRWLEDDKSAETGNWVNAQNEVTNGYLSSIDFRSAVKERLTELENFEKIGTPYKRGDYYYFSKNDGLQNQSIIYRVKNFGEEEEVFLDPNTFSNDGTTSLGGQSFSKDNTYFAYSTSTGGSDWREIYVMNVESKELLSDVIRWAKFTGISWYKDGFYYQRFAEPKAGDELKGANKFGKVYYHKLGTSQEEDVLIYENPDNPENRFGPSVSEDERFLFIYSNVGTSGNELYVKNLASPQSAFIPLVKGFEKDHYVVATEGDSIILHTNESAPNNRLVKLHYTNTNPTSWRTLLPETDNVMDAGAAGKKIFASYLVDAKTSIKQYDYRGFLEREVELPGIGTAGGFDGLETDQEIFYSFTSFTYPTSVFIYSIVSGESRLHRRPTVDFDPEAYETKQIFYTSKDGTKVPMFIVHKKGLVLNGKNPTWLYSYGGFNISLTPSFNT